jgi:hypothetical protein
MYITSMECWYCNWIDKHILLLQIIPNLSSQNVYITFRKPSLYRFLEFPTLRSHCNVVLHLISVVQLPTRLVDMDCIPIVCCLEISNVFFGIRASV